MLGRFLGASKGSLALTLTCLFGGGCKVREMSGDLVEPATATGELSDGLEACPKFVAGFAEKSDLMSFLLGGGGKTA